MREAGIDLNVHDWWLIQEGVPVAFFTNEQLAVETAWDRSKGNDVLSIRTPEGQIRNWHDYSHTVENKYVLKVLRHKDVK